MLRQRSSCRARETVIEPTVGHGGSPEALADAGLVVLLTDKRGCGASEGDWLDAGFEDLASDALAGVEYLVDVPGVDPSRIGLVGLSQGGWVAPLAAARSADVAFVIDISGAAVGFLEQIHCEMRNTAVQAGLDADGVSRVLEINRAVAGFLLRDDWHRYETLRTAGLNSDIASVAEGFPDRRDHPKWKFLRKVLTYDPLPYWTALEQPALVILGDLDEADNVPVSESVRRLEHAFKVSQNERAQVVVLENAGHGLLTADRTALLPEFVDTLGHWLQQVVGAPD